MISKNIIIMLIVLGVLIYFFARPAALVSESSAYTQCSKVSGTEATCNYYNRGTNPDIEHSTVEMPRFNEWATSNGVVYNKCKVTSISMGTVSACSCGPGSGSYGCACCVPQSTSLNTVYDTVGNTCPIEFDRWWSHDASCSDNGGNGISYSGTVIFFSETPQCGSQITCGEWSACTDYHAQSRTCIDECSIQTTETRYCDPLVPLPPGAENPISTPSPELPPVQPPVLPSNLLDWIVFKIRGLLAPIISFIAIPFLPP